MIGTTPLERAHVRALERLAVLGATFSSEHDRPERERLVAKPRALA